MLLLGITSSQQKFGCRSSSYDRDNEPSILYCKQKDKCYKFYKTKIAPAGFKLMTNEFVVSTRDVNFTRRDYS